MAALGSDARVQPVTNALEQLAARRSEIALTVGRYAEATEPLLAWFAAGRPSSKGDIAVLGPYAQEACGAVFDLERLTTELADAVRAAQTPEVPVTPSVKAVRA